MSSREVVTLQFGHYSNFVGTHWWNLQESSFVYDTKTLSEFPKEVHHDVLFREGRTLKGQVTFTPRLVLIDLKDSLGCLKKEGTLYDVDREEDIRWTGDVTLHQAPAAKKNKFLQDIDTDENVQSSCDKDAEYLKEQGAGDTSEHMDTAEQVISDQSEVLLGSHVYNLDNHVQVWSDFLGTGLHPRSIHLLDNYCHNNPEQPFNIFGAGQQVCKDFDQWDAIEERIRYFSEESDSLQGFQLLVDNHNAFGGVASTVLDYLSDEYSNKTRLTFGLTPACPPDQTATDRSIRILNSALSLYHCVENSSLYVPLSLASTLWKTVGQPVQSPYLQYKAELDYHTSAILAASIDTMTLPYRREVGPCKMIDLTCSLSMMGRKVAALNTSLPFPLRHGRSFAETLMDYGNTDPWVSLTPHVKCCSSPTFNSCVVRGVPSSMVKCETHPEKLPRLLSSCATLDDVLKLYLAETYPSSHYATSVIRDGVKVGTPFPHIFSKNVNYQGFLTESLRSSSCGVESAAALTSLQSSVDVFSYVDSLEGCVSKFNIAKHPHFIEAGLELDQFTEMVQALKDLAQCYKISGGVE